MAVTLGDTRGHPRACAGAAGLTGVPDFPWCRESVEIKNLSCCGCRGELRALRHAWPHRQPRAALRGRGMPSQGRGWQCKQVRKSEITGSLRALCVVRE